MITGPRRARSAAIAAMSSVLRSADIEADRSCGRAIHSHSKMVKGEFGELPTPFHALGTRKDRPPGGPLMVAPSPTAPFTSNDWKGNNVSAPAPLTAQVIGVLLRRLTAGQTATVAVA